MTPKSLPPKNRISMASVLGFPAGLILIVGTNYLEKKSAYEGQKKKEYLDGEMWMLELAKTAFG